MMVADTAPSCFGLDSVARPPSRSVGSRNASTVRTTLRDGNGADFRPSGFSTQGTSQARAFCRPIGHDDAAGIPRASRGPHDGGEPGHRTMKPAAITGRTKEVDGTEGARRIGESNVAVAQVCSVARR